MKRLGCAGPRKGTKRIETQESIAAGKPKHRRAKIMEPRKKVSKTTSTGAAGKKNIEMGYKENELPAKKKRKTTDASIQINPKQKKVKVSTVDTARWKPLPQSTKDYITAAVDIAIYNALPQKGSKMEASQEHLSQLRHRFLDRCSSIKVPVSKLRDLKNVQRSYASKKEHLREDEASLQILQDELDKILATLERNGEEVDKLQNEISSLRTFLDETENNEFQNVGVGVLNLPELPEASFQQTTLQEKLMAIGNHDALLQDLQTIQRCPAVQNLLTFLEHAHAEADTVSPIDH
ncbi:centromere protein Q-like [Stegostoma tigrinum]|uniref:centromere protein Q-like n=1 Tax=Stegostoma tigrinum TaxID=3053191 RepID=UPI00202AD782|nr:centromere protein Q-like [Stegostoma tigrinum]